MKKIILIFFLQIFLFSCGNIKNPEDNSGAIDSGNIEEINSGNTEENLNLENDSGNIEEIHTENNLEDLEKIQLERLDGEFVFITSWTDYIGGKPYGDYEIKGNNLALTTYSKGYSEYQIQDIKISFEKVGDNYYFSGENISGKIIKESCNGEQSWQNYDYSTKVNYGDKILKGCVTKIPLFAIGDTFFEYGKIGNFNEYAEQTGLDEIKNNSKAKYFVRGIYKNFIWLGIGTEGEGGYSSIIEKTSSGREKVSEGQEMTYEDCKKLKEKDENIWNWGPFRGCSEVQNY